MAEILITLTGGNLRNNHVYLSDHLAFFPSDSLGGPSARDRSGTPLTLLFDGTEEKVITDIPDDKLIFRARAPWGRFFQYWKLAAGDNVSISETGARSYRITPAGSKQHPPADPVPTRSEEPRRASHQPTGRRARPRSRAARNRLASATRHEFPDPRDAEAAHSGALFSRFQHGLLQAPLGTETVQHDDLLIYRDDEIETFFAPFDALNRDAKVVLIGITPGGEQVRNAVAALQSESPRPGDPPDGARWRAQRAGSFSGRMRSRLSWMLEQLRLPVHLGVESADALLAEGLLVQTTSCVRYPTFRVRGMRNWNGTKPPLLVHPETRAYVFEVLAAELSALPAALVLPLGKVAGEAVGALVGAGLIPRDRCCIGTPHPSPANGGMYSQFAERSDRLSDMVAGWFAQR